MSRSLSTAEAAEVFSALGDPTRLAVVARLCGEGPLSIARLADGAEVTRQAITKHLHALAGAGVVRGSRRGREQIWELERAGSKSPPLSRRDLGAMGRRDRPLAEIPRRESLDPDSDALQ